MDAIPSEALEIEEADQRLEDLSSDARALAAQRSVKLFQCKHVVLFFQCSSPPFLDLREACIRSWLSSVGTRRGDAGPIDWCRRSQHDSWLSSRLHTACILLAAAYLSSVYGFGYLRRSKQSAKITHLKNQNVIGASIVQSFMTKNHNFVSMKDSNQTSGLDKACLANKWHIIASSFKIKSSTYWKSKNQMVKLTHWFCHSNIESSIAGPGSSWTTQWLKVLASLWCWTARSWEGSRPRNWTNPWRLYSGFCLVGVLTVLLSWQPRCALRSVWATLWKMRPGFLVRFEIKVPFSLWPPKW